MGNYVHFLYQSTVLLSPLSKEIAALKFNFSLIFETSACECLTSPGRGSVYVISYSFLLNIDFSIEFRNDTRVF